MFDNNPPRANNGNFGQAKPEDIFADLEQNANSQVNRPSMPTGNAQQPLRPMAAQVRQNQPNAMPQYGNVDNSQIPAYQASGGNSLKYLIIGILTFAVLLGGGFYVYQAILVPKFSNNQATNENNQPTAKTEDNNMVNSDGGQAVDSNVLPPENMATSSELTNEINSTSSNPEMVSSSLSYSDATSTETLSGGEAVDQTKDSDNDGLTDVREIELGINPNKADSDDDGLPDYEEVEVWKTNPSVKDTDGDGYSDGDEVKNKYNPNGPGKAIINK